MGRVPAHDHRVKPRAVRAIDTCDSARLLSITTADFGAPRAAAMTRPVRQSSWTRSQQTEPLCSLLRGAILCSARAGLACERGARPAVADGDAHTGRFEHRDSSAHRWSTSASVTRCAPSLPPRSASQRRESGRPREPMSTPPRARTRDRVRRLFARPFPEIPPSRSVASRLAAVRARPHHHAGSIGRSHPRDNEASRTSGVFQVLDAGSARHSRSSHTVRAPDNE